jgi:hypothetical protein
MAKVKTEAGGQGNERQGNKFLCRTFLCHFFFVPFAVKKPIAEIVLKPRNTRKGAGAIFCGSAAL